MALGGLPPTQENWGRWPHSQPAAAEFNMMEAGMVPYDCCRTGTAAPIPRPEMAQHFLPGPFTPAPMPSPVSPQYQTPISYGGYQPYSPPAMLDAPFKPQDCVERVDDSPSLKRSQSPTIKSEVRSPASACSPPLKTIAANTPAPGVPVHQFNTAIDKIVRVIEAKREILIPEDKVEPEEMSEKTDGRENQVERARGKTKRKRFFCDVPGCSKMFAQRNNLDTHRRSHTGESPYVCPYCFRRFTQSVNLKSHINRHTGARPYRCSLCPKTFPQPSNVKAHMKTHVKRELRAHWVCRFGTCQRTFTAKGNLKNHQNQYHVQEIEAFNAKLAATVDKSMLSPEDIEMAQYLADVHNLANKGIKGRGKGRKVKRVVLLHPPQQQHHQPQQQLPSPSPSPVTATIHAATPYPMSLLPHGLPNFHTLPQQQHQHQHQQPTAHHQNHPGNHPFYGLSNPAAYSMSTAPVTGRPPHSGMLFGGSLTLNTRDVYGHHAHAHAQVPHHGSGAYGMLDADQMSDVSSVHGSTPVMMHHHHHHHHQHGGGGFEEERGGDQLAFGERLY